MCSLVDLPVGNAGGPPAAQNQEWREPGDFTEQELRTLPPYCRAQRYIRRTRNLQVPEAEIAKWENALGHDYMHLHHYCWALNSLNRGQRATNEQLRHRYFDNAVRNMEYVQDAADPAFVLMPEISVKKGFALRLMGQDAAASREFLLAIRLRPDYSPAYAALSDYYKDLGELEEARQVLEDGLTKAPKSTTLKRKLEELETQP